MRCPLAMHAPHTPARIPLCGVHRCLSRQSGSYACSEGERTIFFLSQKLMATECKYGVIEKEDLAMKWAIN